MNNLFKKKTKDKILGKLLPKNYKKMPKWKIALYYIFYIFIAITFVLVVAFVWFAKDLPTPSKIASRRATESTKLYDRTGQILLYETGEQKRTIIEGDQISQNLKDATVAVEDSKFFNHHGFDTKAILSAVFDKVTGKSSRTRGGSTITQQFVKNALLTSDRSLTRKFKELIISIELEFMYSKDQILTMYLNEIPYGNNTAGAEAAARMYYGKTAKDLTLSEAATLAAIPQAPTYYSPYGTHSQSLINRKNYVLDRMADTGKITKEQATEAKGIDTTTVGTVVKQRHDSILAPHFAMYVLENVAEEYGEEKVQKDGLKIITTLDFDKQKIAEESVKNGATKITRYGASNAALVAVDPKTGQIFSMVGSKDFYDTNIDGNVNITDSLRQPGSSFKPIVYATAFKKPDLTPSKILFDFQTDFGGGYVPQNYNGKFNGPITMRQALDNSLNIPAIKAFSLAGPENVIKTAQDLGVTSLTQTANHYGLSLALGTGEIKPIEMAGAFSTFANNGVRHDTTPILKISNTKGDTIYEYKAESDKGQQALDPQIAYLMNNILSDNNARSLVFGTRTPLFFADRLVAAKTGTTSDFKDAWTVGYTPSLAVAVWVGNSDATKMKNGADGSVIAAPIFHEYVAKVLEGTPAEEFTRPAGIQDITVEKYSNKLPTDISGEKTSDIFASWQVPKETDDIHVKVRVCKSSGRLAAKDIPDSLTEEKIFTILHSERPDNPNWENPVRAWAESAGMANLPPTESCKAEEVSPTVSFINPSNNSTISGTTTLSVTATSPTAIKFVEFFIDDISIGQATSTTSTFSKDYNFNNLSAGNHKITAVATNQDEVSATNSITVTVAKNPSGSNTISAVTVKNILATSATISWNTTLPSTSQILYGTSPAAVSTPTAIISAMTTSHSVQVSGLSKNTKYYFKVVSIDGSNNSSSSDTSTFSTASE